jgi:hypothetical protein
MRCSAERGERAGYSSRNGGRVPSFRRGFCVFWILLAPLIALGQQQPQPDANSLPVKRVVLYKNGVGYFEHLGHVRGDQDVTISFTSGQLNDVLKSLTVLDLNGGRITGVGYGSTEPIDKQLGDLRLPVGEKTSLSGFLEALRGARLEVRSGTAVVTGRLLSVEHKTQVASGTTLEVDYLSLVTDNGEVKTAALSPSFSVRLLEKGLTGKVDRFLNLVSSGREPDVRRMVVSTAGSGERSLFVSYISEVPIWKSTYRIVLSAKAGQGPLLQGWAIVDNTVGQDWDNVELSLVAGAPQSFVENLSQPYYARRPVVPVPGSVNLTPQTYQSTLISGGAHLSGKITDPAGAAIPGATVEAYDTNGAQVGEANADSQGVYELSSLPEGTTRLVISQPGFQTAVLNGVLVSTAKTNVQDAWLSVGSLNESVSVTAPAPGVNTEMSATSRRFRSPGSGGSLGSGTRLGGERIMNKAPAPPPPGGGMGGGVYRVEDARTRLQAAAQARDLGDLFAYKLKEPITIRKNRSALVPIVQSSITAEKVSVWNERAGLPRPQRALWLTNSTGLTLDGGSFSVLEDETFAGEGIFTPIKPGEKRLVSYALDLALNVSSRLGSERQRVSRVRVSHGVMLQESELREKKTYTIRNEDSSPRVVIVEHPVRLGYELRGEAKPVETTADWMRFRLQVEPKQTASLLVEEAKPIQTTYSISNVTSAQVTGFINQHSIDKTIADALRQILAQKKILDEIDSQDSYRNDRMDKIFDDQQRLRENMKALKGSAEEKALVQRYVQQLNQQEDELAKLRTERQQLAAKRESAQATLDGMIEALSFDVKL